MANRKKGTELEVAEELSALAAETVVTTGTAVVSFGRLLVRYRREVILYGTFLVAWLWTVSVMSIALGSVAIATVAVGLYWNNTTRRVLGRWLRRGQTRRRWTDAYAGLGEQAPALMRMRDLDAGQRLDVEIHPGTSVATLTKQSGKLATALKVREVRVTPNQADASKASVVLVERDPFENAEPTVSPLLKAQKTSVHDPLELGLDEEGEPIVVTWNPGEAGHTLICGITGSGKSSLVHAYVAHTALDPDARLILLDPNWVQFTPWESCASRPVVGPDPAEAVEALEDIQRIMRNRFNQMRAGRQWSTRRGEPTYTVVIDELPRYFTKADKESSAKVAAILLDILQSARATGVRIIAIAQRPSAEILDGDVREQFAHVIGLRVGRIETARIIFGSDPPPIVDIPEDGFEGVGYIGSSRMRDRRFRGHLIRMEDVDEIAKRASSKRLDHDLAQLTPPHPPSGGEADVTVHRDYGKAIRDALAAQPGLTLTELGDVLRGKRTDWHRTLKGFLADGSVTRTGNGVNKSPYRHYLQGTEPDGE